MTVRPTLAGAAARWGAVASRTIYFGHQSVGRDLIAGIKRLNNDGAIGLSLIQTDDPTCLTGPAFVHFLAGTNRDYASKNAALLRLLNTRNHADGAIVLLKYCYVDMRDDLSPYTIFAAYCEMTETIQLEYPDVTVVHATMPLTTVESAFQARASQIMGRPTLRQASIARHRYNELLRAEFVGNQPIFDLARVEATRPDGTVAMFMSQGSAIETLAPENTYDGGHLTPQCQLAAAEALLDVLADVVEGSNAFVR